MVKILLPFLNFNQLSEISFTSIFKFKPVKEISDNWLKFKNGSKIFYLDNELKHPWFSNELVVRGLQQEKWCIILEGMSARLNRKKVREEKKYEILSGSSS